MIKLKTGNNEIALTLTEKTTIVFPVFLFRFVGKTTNNEYAFIAADVSNFKYRFNQFIIKCVNGAVNPLLGEVKLVNGDEYEYYIYEQVSATNLDYKLSLNMVESGLMKFEKTIAKPKQYEKENNRRKEYIKS